MSVRLVETPATSANLPAADAMTFGDHLRAARTARGITVRDISVRTRIALRSLEALEQNEIGKLPGGIFSRAFVRAYAQEVGLDPDDTVRLFVQQFPVDHVTAGTTDAVDGEIGRGQEAQRRRQRLGYLLAAAIGLPLVGLAAYLIVSARRPANAADLTSPSASAPTTAVAPATAGGDTAAVTPASATTAPATATSATRTPTTTTAPANAAAAGRSATPGTSGTPAANGASALATPDTLQLAIAAEGPCWIRVRSDGTIRYQGLLNTGDKQTGDARNNFELIIGDAGTFRFSVNGHPGRIVGKPGEVVIAHITRANWQTWLQQ